MRKIAILIFALATAAVFGPSRQMAVVGTPSISSPKIGKAVAFAVSAPVSTKQVDRAVLNGQPSSKAVEVGRSIVENVTPDTFAHDADSAAAIVSDVQMPAPSLSFDGLTNFDDLAKFGFFLLPPDSNGDVGPNDYVQVVNSLGRIYSKAGEARSDPFKLSDLFAPLQTECASRNDGSPVVLYDPLADRWLISQNCTSNPPFRQMIAVSKNGDPAGTYYLYEFVMPNFRLNDSPKFGVWPDGYYMSTEEFIGSDFAGSGAFAFDREKMLVGDPNAGYIYFNLPSTSAARHSGLLPADLDGLTPPHAGLPNVFSGFIATEYGDAEDAIRLFDFHADFSSPENSSLEERPESPIPVASFDPTSPDGRQDIAQRPPGAPLDSNSDRLMYRAAYRNFGEHESLILNQTVRLTPVSEPYRAGVRVYKLVRNGAAFSVVEQTTLGDTGSSRWIGGAAEDHQGNIAVGYNFVNDLKAPSLVYSGRLSTDPVGTFRSEATLAQGTGVQKAFGFRWGDYSGMTVDPTDDCTFWMTGEYFSSDSEAFSDFTWLTRIGRFKFDECTAAPRGYLTVRVVNDYTNEPLENTRVEVFPNGDAGNSPFTRRTGANGATGSIMLPGGVHTLRAQAAGFESVSEQIAIAPGTPQISVTVRLRPIPVLEPAGIDFTAESCSRDQAAEPGETVSVSLTLRNTGRQMTRDLRVTLTNTNEIMTSNAPVAFGMFLPGETVTRPFTFTVSPQTSCGAPVDLTFRLRDGRSDLGTLTLPLQTGTSRVALHETFDSVAPPGLPAGWTTTTSGAQPVWSTSNARTQSPPNAVYSPSQNQIGINELVSPQIQINSTEARLQFRNWYELESTFLRNKLYDGSVLEIKIGASDWQDILAAGGQFESGGYDGVLDSCCQNPLSGRLVWSGKSGIDQQPEYITSLVRLPGSAAGQAVRFRWRVGTDFATFREGQYIDDITVTDGYSCTCGVATTPR